MYPVPKPQHSTPSAVRPRESRALLAARPWIRSAPEPDVLEHALLLGDHETTGPLPLGFELDLFGVPYTHFDLSTDGFIRFGNGGASGHHYVSLGGLHARPLGAGLLAFELRGTAPRRRLVVQFAGVPRPGESAMAHSVVQIILHERTGMIEIHETDPR